MVDTGLPSDSLRWVLQYLSDYVWGNVHMDILDELAELGAPSLVIDMLYEMCKTQGNA